MLIGNGNSKMEWDIGGKQVFLTERKPLSESSSKDEKAAFDIKGHRNAPPGLRIWCGATINIEDIQKLLPWLDWCFHEIVSNY